ncbi:DUF1501 domain-containing protein [Nannocystis sp.]|uniref:DUF1501 domain-containing protein n=1 Tax=Nannocystis sp. TaxID=1962667 RepID=UPI0025F6BAA2|nr:DUF1501 domain-containing protein [Nannocystis sp.]MBK7826837.1 DUF1501 domain-containing protein [Nannocystis sp.]
MDRRSFIKIAAMTGLAVSAPLGVRRAFAQPEPYKGPFFVLVNASGGWDPTYLCDPKPKGAVNRIYDAPASAGKLKYAPIPIDDASLGLDPGSAAYLMSNQQFFEKYAASLTVLNGIDMATNNHDGGSRATWSGRLAEGFPSFGALVAASRAPESSLAYISSGGYDATEGLIPLTRMSSIDALKRVAYPNKMDPNDAESDLYHSNSTAARIRKAQDERLAEALKQQRLPRVKAAMNELMLARASDDVLKDLVLPGELVTLPGYQLSDLQALQQQVQLAVAAFKAGMAVAVNLNLGGFDTHGNHDRDQPRQIAKLLKGVDFLMTEAEAAGIAGNLVVMIGSDFARGPGYNGPSEYDGKDHWSITSAMLMGKGIAKGRVIGGTTDDQRALAIDPASLGLKEGGKVLKPETIHLALRKLAGVGDNELAKLFPLAGDDMPKLLTG